MNRFITIVKRLLNIMTGICYALIILLLCITLPYAAGYRPTVILSGSMEPAIMTGDLVYIHKAESIEEVAVGDVIAFQRSEDKTPITHRVMQINESEQTFQTKGDANESEDGWSVAFTEMKGKVTSFSIPKAGYAIQYAKQPLVILGIAFVIIMNFILGSLTSEEEKEPVKNKRNYRRNKKSHKRRKGMKL